MAYTEAGHRASMKYKAANIKRIPLDVQNAEFEEIRKAAASAGESVNGFIKNAIRARMEREQVQT